MTRESVVKTNRNKHCRVCAALTIACLFAVVTSAEDQPKKYDLKLNWKNAVEGHKSELLQDDSEAMTMKVLNRDGQILSQREDNQSRSFAAVEVISKVENGKPAVLRWTFSKATQHSGDQDLPFAFQRRTVVVTKDGEEFGHIKLLMELWMTKFGPMQLDNPILMKVETDIDTCIDGAQPDGTLNVTMDAKGYSAVSVDSPPREAQLSINLEKKVQHRRKTIK